MSNPNQCSALGPSCDRLRSVARGSTPVNSWGTTAIVVKMTSRTDPSRKNGFFRRVFQASENRLACRISPPATASSAAPDFAVSTSSAVACEPDEVGAPPMSVPRRVSLIADPRVEQRVQDVHHQDEEDVEEHQQGDDPADDSALLAQDRLEGGPAEAGDVEHRLGHDRPAHQGADVRTDEGHHRDQAVAQRVLADNGPRSQALGASGANVVVTQVLREAGARQPGDVGQSVDARMKPG